MALSSPVINRGWGYWDVQKVAGIDSLSIQVWPFQPDVIVFSHLPGWLAYGLITFLQRFMAGYFTLSGQCAVSRFPGPVDRRESYPVVAQRIEGYVQLSALWNSERIRGLPEGEEAACPIVCL